jgi:hypothetical protein
MLKDFVLLLQLLADALLLLSQCYHELPSNIHISHSRESINEIHQP